MIYTSVCEILGIRYPIFQGGMAHISDAVLAAAVSNAGGLGIISGANGDVVWLENEIDKARSMTTMPFGVNVMLKGQNTDEIAALLTRKRVSVITTGAGNPQKYISQWKAAGIKVIPVVPSSAFARILMRSGVDAVIAEGCESGGHVGELTTMALVPQVCDVVNIPVIAAGGIADGRGAAAAFMLGAQGIQLGTKFLTAFECNVSRTYKDKILNATDTSTIVTGKRLGHPVRSLKTPFSREYSKVEYSNISMDELEQMAVGTLKAAVYDGDEHKGCFLAGQIAGLIKKEQSTSDIIGQIFTEAEAILRSSIKYIR